MKKQNNALDTENISSYSPLTSKQELPHLLSKGIISICVLLLLIITITSSSALLSSPIHPIGLLLGILIPAYLFLLFALIRQHSLFSTLLFFLQKQFSKLQSQAAKNFTKNPQPPLQVTPKELALLTKIIMHSAWIVIFVGLLIGLFFQFTLKQYQFNLYSTLFPYESGIYLQIIKAINYLPSFIFGELISETLIANSLQGDPSPAENAIWAKWILLMIFIYGLFPRVILSFSAYYQYQRYQKKSAQQPTTISTDAIIIDPAISRPVSARSPKTITSGSGEMHVALDFAYPLNTQITIINHRTEFTDLKNRLHEAPLDRLTLYIDSSLTPDRSLLRRIYSLLNCAINNTIVLVEADTHSRYPEWQQKIAPNLEAHEQIETAPLSKFQ